MRIKRRPWYGWIATKLRDWHRACRWGFVAGFKRLRKVLLLAWEVLPVITINIERKDMKHTKFIGLRSLFAIVATIGLTRISDVSAQTSGNLSLAGEVPLILSITVTPYGDASALVPSMFYGNILIGFVDEICNDADGYTVSLSSSNGGDDSANSGILTGQNFGEDLPYTLQYGSVPVGFVNGSAQVTDVSDKTLAAGVQKNIAISYDGRDSNLAADSYQDTLTFTIAAK
jgi:spore coat protein U-like protein